MASCQMPCALAGSTWLAISAICAFLSLMMADSDCATCPCGDDSDNDMLPPKAACWSDCTPVKIAESVGKTTPFAVHWIAGTEVPVILETHDKGLRRAGAHDDDGAGQLAALGEGESNDRGGGDGGNGHGGLYHQRGDQGRWRTLAEDLPEVRKAQRDVVPAFPEEGADSAG